MNKRVIYIAILLAGVTLICWWFLREARQSPPIPAADGVSVESTAPQIPTDAANPALPEAVDHLLSPDSTQPIPGAVPPKPKMFKAKGYPPKTPEEKAMWDWWEAMEKIDPVFEWKTPIEFYGKVVDQFSNPVANAEIVLNWTTVVGPIPDPKKTIYADEDGRFAVNGIQGNGITITADKEGYRSTRDSHQSFEYAKFYRDNFHFPDPNNPVVFHLHKMLGSEPMYQFELDSKMSPNGVPLELDVVRGRLQDDGDFAFSIRVGSRHDEKGPDYSVTLHALKGAAFAPTTEAFPYTAPETGYQTETTISQMASNVNYGLVQKLQFYARTQDGKYGMVWAEVSLSRFGDDVNFNSTVRYNPSGSRNLEFDEDKWINR
jgi:hypothetical protein